MTAAAPAPDALTFVTVVFDAEVLLLELQARSMARLLEPSAVAAVIVLDNSVRGLSARRRRRLRDAYGDLWDRVTIIPTAQLVDARAATGWRSQQAAKLAVAARVGTAHYVVLDAKNHVIRPVGVSAFVGSDGRAHGALHSYETHPLRRSLESALGYLDATPDAIAAAVESFPPTATPFVFSTAAVLEMIADVERRSGQPFDVEFEKRELLEFFLYSGWLSTRGPGIEQTMDGVSIPSPTVWPRLASSAGVQEVIDESVRDDAFVFAVHRQALVRADRAARSLIARHWAEVGLFADERSAASFITRFRRAYRPAILRTRLAERLRRSSRTAAT